ncbi:hypothetical protein ABPG74_021460 [Tetrahymena malaccensis]
MQKNLTLQQESIEQLIPIQDIKRKQISLITPINKLDNIDKRWQEIKVSGKNLESRSYHAICINGDYLYTYGGYENNEIMSSLFARLKIHNHNNKYDWEIISKKTSLTPGTRRRHTLVSFQDKIYLFGGQTSNYQTVRVNDVYEFNIQQNEWNIKKNNNKQILIPQLYSHNAYVYKNEMYIFGGYSTQSGYSNQLYSFNLINFSWRIIQNNSSPSKQITKRSGASLSLYSDYVFVFGGQNEETRLNDLWCLNMSQTDNQGNIIWQKINPEGDIPSGRSGHQSVTYKNYLFVFGGMYNMTQELNDVQAYDVIQNRWIQVHTDSNFLYAASPLNKHKMKNQQRLLNESNDSRSNSIRYSLKRADSQLTHDSSKNDPYLQNTNRKSQFRKQKSLFSHTEKEEIQNQKIIKNQYTYEIVQRGDMKNSYGHFGKFVTEQKQKEFQIKKQHFLSTFEIGLTSEKISPIKQTLNQQNKNSKQMETLYSRSDSPLTSALKTSLCQIGNQSKNTFMLNGSSTYNSKFNEYTLQNKKSQNLNRSFTIQAMDIKLPPIAFEKEKSIVVGKKPCARDGHACCIIRQNQLLIFGGDRHNMSFSDIYLFDLDMAIQKHITSENQE